MFTPGSSSSRQTGFRSSSERPLLTIFTGERTGRFRPIPPILVAGANVGCGSIRDIRDGRTPQSSTIHQPSGSADCANSTPVKSIPRVARFSLDVPCRNAFMLCNVSIGPSWLNTAKPVNQPGFTMPQPVFDFCCGRTDVPSRSHSPSLDQRRRPDTLRTAIAMAFFCPTSTTSRLPRVMPV